MQKNYILTLILVLVGVILVSWPHVKTALWKDTFPIACTMEAKLCPDGSAVGRTGPNCEFAMCPDVLTPTPKVVTAENLVLTVGQKGKVGNLSITVIEVLEDSRCPVDVVCIQAGTVRVKTILSSPLGTSEQIFTLGQLITTEAEVVTLTDVDPAPYSMVTRKSSDYRFHFEVKNI